MKSAGQESRLEKGGLEENYQVAARSELLPKSWIKLKISQTPPINAEIYSRFGIIGKN